MKGGQLHLKEQNVFVAIGCLDSNDWFSIREHDDADWCKISLF